MAARISVWAYPWDIADEGVNVALDWLRDAGFDAIELCPNYHAISTFSPRNRKRSIFYSEQGAVYFPARADRYDRIKPKVYEEPEVVSAYAAVSGAIGARGMQLNAWVIGMFQPWIARAYPDTAIENAFGHRSYAQTCPASPDVQTYLAALLVDLCDQFSIASISLESVGHPGFAYGWVRERILISLGAWTRFMAGLCFCTNCMAAARAHGVDAPGVRRSVADELRTRLDASPDDPSDEDVAALVQQRADADEMFRGYLEAREQTASGIVQRIRHELRHTDVRTGVQAVSAGWAPSGLRLSDLLDTVGEVLLPDPTDEPEEAAAQVELARGAERDIQLAVSQTGAASARPNGPAFEERVARIADLGVDRVMIYNFALLTPDTLRHIGGLLRARLG